MLPGESVGHQPRVDKPNATNPRASRQFLIGNRNDHQ
jgi:hypothetical protein